MSEVLFTINGFGVTAGLILAIIGGLCFLLLVALLAALSRQSRARALDALDQQRRNDEQAMRIEDLQERLLHLLRAQSEASGAVQSIAAGVNQKQEELTRTVNERLDAVTHRLGENMTNAARATAESLTQLHERLAVVDAAQARMSELTGHMMTLKDVLANKQARGVFGQGRMEAIVADGLPKDAYAFQYTLTNGKRPDCAVFLPGDKRPLTIDAKFPLESITALREAQSDEIRKTALQRLKQDISKHIGDISERYLLPGETQEIALMFVPSESVYAELHEQCDDVLQKAFRSRIILVSPSLLMLAIQVVQAIVRDARMREQAEAIQTEVGRIMEDIGRLRARAGNLQKHFTQASEDVGQVLVSADKVAARGAKIEALELNEDKSPKDTGAPVAVPLQLKLGGRD
ncbi:MAG: DNA recombination protein RmuC [Xanthobacteraceae bacterium]|nr:DNA recombination protein RmuC [Xanthobacteraceae bacterium]QYK45301.1 MAG: DNA recombination protein RmuC [Xanthobacteraceae bacterium]